MLVQDNKYNYSRPITIREWNGGAIWVQVGYPKGHLDQHQVILFKRYATKDGPLTDRYYIKGEADWMAIRHAVEQLWPELQQDVSAEAIDSAVRKVGREVQLLDLVAKYPEILSQIPDDLDIFKLPSEQKEALRKLLAAGGAVAQGIIRRLSEEPVEDLEDFVKILQELRLSSVNSLVNHVTSRLGFIDAFEKAIHNDSSYERRGTTSIHNLLRANIWILNRNYSVLHDDETLKNIIHQQFQSDMDDSDPTLSRPDFLCMTGRREPGNPIDQLVLIEIKRPSVTLNMTHMSRLMEYKDTLERYSGGNIKNFRCFLIGRERHNLLRGNDLSASGYIVKTYTDFIAEARQFYEEYLEIVRDDDLAI